MNNKEKMVYEFMNNYQKLKVVGKGAFGTAVLYEKPDGNKVVIKEIPLREMTAQERSSALNEVSILSAMSHPNIISYYGSHENDDVLLIEMEYADGGTLSQMLLEQDSRLSERVILQIFSQIVSALVYMHSNSILHRDLKTANIFLNKNGTVKVGDFGISKIMLTKACAQTILGTPYYMSPEMCEGKNYDQKSDMWALGCILYEMATFQKPFIATSLPALVGQILKGETQDLPKGYTSALGQLVRCLLEVDIQKRSSAIDVLDLYLPQVYNNLRHKGDIYVGTPVSTVSASDISPKIRNRSILYQLKSSKAETCLKPISLPPMIQIRSVAIGSSHFIVITEDGISYSWGENAHGQLGNGEKSSWRHFPHILKAFDSIKITNACAGSDFSIFLTENGEIFSCGNGCYGCLGLGDYQMWSSPKYIGISGVVEIKCGPYHVIALDKYNHLYSWGKGTDGALGLGDENNRCSPTKINLDLTEQVNSIFCGIQCTAILLMNGMILVCGSNVSNKLGVFKSNMDKILIMTFANIENKILYVSFGENHTALLVEGGYVIMMGQNNKAELGIGNEKKCIPKQPVLVKKLHDRYIKMIECGPNYTVCVCENQAIYLWGTRCSSQSSDYYSNHSRFSTIANNKVQDVDTLGQNTKSFAYYLTGLNQSETIEEPENILVLYASKHQMEKNNILTVSGLFPLSHSILLTINTTVPTAK